ncbi:MAG TPA: M57 family metalloprotease [Longimicrobium sp.]|nr:M57 family metalloprotease [Longimicrobium sp.]
MRYSIRGGAAVVGAGLALAACDDTAERIAGSGGDPLAARVAEMGFDASTIRDAGDYLLVEGDVLLSKAALRAGPPAGGRLRAPDGPRLQYATDYLVADAYTIGVNFSQVSGESSAWATAVNQALSQWTNNAPGARIQMLNTSVYTGVATNITVQMGQCVYNAIACATFPTGNGAPGPSITIDRDHGSLPSSQKLYTMVHELGHTLGLRHTNWQARGEPQYSSDAQGANHIPGTPGPEGDAASVMNGVIQTWNGFSYFDRVAARKLYPGGLGPRATGSLSGSTPVITWPAMLDAVSYKVYFQETYYVSDWFGFLSTASTETYLGTTSGTSWTDPSRAYSSSPWVCVVPFQGYVVKAVFSDGTESGYGFYACFT